MVAGSVFALNAANEAHSLLEPTRSASDSSNQGRNADVPEVPPKIQTRFKGLATRQFL
jgi:hypothetical protein